MASFCLCALPSIYPDACSRCPNAPRMIDTVVDTTIGEIDMGLRFTAAKDTGDIDTVDYKDFRVEYVMWLPTIDRIEVRYQLGNFDDVTGEFTPGVLPHQEYVIQDDETNTDYTTLFDETSKVGTDTVADRFYELVVDILKLRLGYAGTYEKPGRGGKKKV